VAVPEDEDAVGQMVADWLRPNWDDEDDYSPETQMTNPAVGRIEGPTATPVIVPSPDGIVATPQAPQRDDAPTRKVG